MPLSLRLSSTVATGCNRARFGSVSTITRFAPSSARSIPTSRVTPRPKRMAEAASSNAFSNVMGGFSDCGARLRGSRAEAGPDDGEGHEHEHREDADARQRGEEGEGAALQS